MKKTQIEWADVVWNPVTGCTKVSDGCRNCYAERLAKRFWGERKFADVRCHWERLAETDHFGTNPKRVFVNSMSDLFHPDVPMVFIGEAITEMISHPTHTFMVLTKRPQRMLEVMEWYGPDLIKDGRNIWWGVSAENQATADERIPLLLEAPVAVRFVSCEPLLGPVNFTVKHGHYETNYLAGYMTTAAEPNHFRGIDWVICGGESGQNARPMHPDWVRGLRDQCIAAGVPFFFKQWGAWLPVSQSGNGWGNIPKNANITQIGSTQFAGVGKKAAGRELDGQMWNQYPEVER